MQLQGTKISNKEQQDQQKQKHPKQQQQAEKSTRQQQSSACTMGHGNPEEASESFARSLRSLASLAPGQIQPSRAPESFPDPPKTIRKPETTPKEPWSVQRAPRPSQNPPRTSQNPPRSQDLDLDLYLGGPRTRKVVFYLGKTIVFGVPRTHAVHAVSCKIWGGQPL